MNHYGAQTQEHWRKHRAAEYAQIEDPATFFTAKGKEIAAEIERRTNEAEQQQQAGQSTDFMANLASLNNVSTTVRDEVMREMAFTEPGSPI
ncbi:hypothetical protein SAMN05421854_110220 [Amycolatopsis rubida]|uniref:Uncharacterized protein n=2 Tax=Amycolatopsis rubida TaxID=112413 RepID=A0A1I5XGN6_9PSEU|nr:hypothetical protein SAMN05421854_110220 [Amycolatopsis rubida]